MQDHPKGDLALTTVDEDDRSEAAALRLVLDLHPAALTLDGLNRELTGGGSQDFSELDATRRAVRDLAGSGLLHHPGEDEMVRPTRAAVRLHDLWER
jgi:hypothetical protein